MVQPFSHHSILLSLWLGHENHFMSDLLDDYNRAMNSQNTSFMNVIANRLVEAGYKIEAEFVINHIFYLTEDIMKKNNDSVSDRFNLIMMCANEISDPV